MSSAALTDSSYVVTLSGEADVLAAPHLRRHLIDIVDCGASEVIVDLLQVPFLDSTILGVLLASARLLRSGGGDMVLVSDDPRALRTFEISGLVSNFRFERTLADAVGHAFDVAVTP